MGVRAPVCRTFGVSHLFNTVFVRAKRNEQKKLGHRFPRKYIKSFLFCFIFLLHATAAQTHGSSTRREDRVGIESRQHVFGKVGELLLLSANITCTHRTGGVRRNVHVIMCSHRQTTAVGATRVRCLQHPKDKNYTTQILPLGFDFQPQTHPPPCREERTHR